MPWRVSYANWLQVETDRVQQIILMPRHWHRVWTAKSLQAELAEIGLDYSRPECEQINDELHRRGIVEDVP